jgi:SAM-dependent methyltransferase
MMRSKDSQDAYGHEVWDYFNKRPSYEVVERSDGYIDPFPSDVAPRLYFASIKDWPEVERKAIRYARGRVLDVGCGAGRVALYLQNQRKLDVLGIDISPLAIRVCKRRGLRKSKLLAFENIDFKPASFDTVIMLGNNFGLFGSRAKAKRLLRKLSVMTSANAVLIGGSLDPYETDNPDHLEYHKRNRAKGRMSGQVRIRVRYRAYIGKWFDYLLVSPDEMMEIASGTGWGVRHITKSEETPYYVGVLRKTEP